MEGKRKLKNIHPGEILNEEFLKPMGITVSTVFQERQDFHKRSFCWTAVTIALQRRELFFILGGTDTWS